MGCDIAIYLEGKDYKGDWKEIELHPASLYPESRNYKLWSFLFGVRSNPDWKHTPYFSRRGFPEDISMQDVREDYESAYSDWHSWTYLYDDEVENIKWPKEFEDCYFKIFLEYILPIIKNVLYTRIRLIVLFHN